MTGYSSLAQSGTIKGKLLDSANRQPLSLATVTIFRAADTSIITYRLSDPQGYFTIPGINFGVNSRMVISYSGYRGFRKEFLLSKDQPLLDLGNILLVNDPQSLEEVVIYAERPPVVVKNDTIEFNASAFKTLPNALVEDLLRKLPGVQVDREGGITVNGKRVNRLLVDGKSFFGDDPKMATRNLPANVIDKIQVTPDKEEEARNTDGDLTNLGSVINITLKKGIKQGWFGKMYAGAGTRERYEAGGIANIYRDTLQLSILGFSNNMNRTGFSMKDVQDLGGFNRSGYNSMMTRSSGGQQGFAINGISFGGTEPGIARITGAGFNLNHAPNSNTSLYLQYFFGKNRSLLDELNNTRQFLHDTVIDTRVSNNSVKRSGSHTVGAGGNFKTDSFTSMGVRINYSNAGMKDIVSNAISTVSNKGGVLSTGIGGRLNESAEQDFNESIWLTRSFRKKGRSLNFSQSFNYQGITLDHITESENRFYYPLPDSVLFEQLRRQELPSLWLSASVNFLEPISKTLSLRTGVSTSFSRSTQTISSFEKNGNGSYDHLNDQLSSGMETGTFRNTLNIALVYKVKKVSITAGFMALDQDITNTYVKVAEPIVFRLFNVVPTLLILWKNISLRYNENILAPSGSNLIPVIDNSNPFYIRYGNPGLVPRHSRNISSNYNKHDVKRGASINAYVSGYRTENDVVLDRRIDEKGIQTVTPVNAGGNRGMYATGSYTREFKNKQQFIFNIRLISSVSMDRRKILINKNEGFQSGMSFMPGIGVGFNWNDIVEIRPDYRLSWSTTRYTNPAFTNLSVVTQYLDGEIVIRTPKRIIWEGNLIYRYNSTTAPGIPKDNVLINAAVSYLFLKDEKGQLRLNVFDLLDRNNNVSRHATQNYIYDSQTTVMQRFFSLTFTYNIRPFGPKRKIGGKERLFFF